MDIRGDGSLKSDINDRYFTVMHREDIPPVNRNIRKNIQVKPDAWCTMPFRHPEDPVDDKMVTNLRVNPTRYVHILIPVLRKP
jgi:hypothetical protein